MSKMRTSSAIVASMEWKQPPVIKIYEALGSIGDGRIRIDGMTAQVDSSNGDKTYDVTYDAAKNAIVTNDNGSYWQGYLGYPAIAYLVATRKIVVSGDVITALTGFAWKELNTTFKNDFAKTQAFIDEHIAATGFDMTTFHRTIDEVAKTLTKLHLQKLPRKRPPVAKK
jgi:hypothetical protein